MRRYYLLIALLLLIVTGCKEKKAKFTPMPPEDSGADKNPPPRPNPFK
jgi:hypothetical protein